MKKKSTNSLSDMAISPRTRKIKKQFFQQINKLLDWDDIETIISKDYHVGKSKTGRKANDPLVLFKMLLLQTWYGLSDYEVEDRVNDSISFSYFCGLSIEDIAPDHSAVSRFRTALTKTGTFEKLFKTINSTLESHNIIIKKGAIVDASIVDTPRKPKGKTTFKVTEDRGEEIKIEKNYPSSVDTDASWVKKRGELHYGYKKHHVTDEEGMILGVVTTTGSKNEISNLEEVLDSADLPERIPVKADKGYKSNKNDELLSKKRLKNQILKKAKKNKKLTKREKQFNKGVSLIRYKVERTFGSIKKWFNGGTARYIGIEKMHTQNLMEAICYNLYRSPGIIMSNCEKM